MQIPVLFDYQGKEFKGILSQVSGSGGGASYHLTVDSYYWGQLSYISGHSGFNGLHSVEPGWRFASPTHQTLEDLAEYFGSVVASWMDSH